MASEFKGRYPSAMAELMVIAQLSVVYVRQVLGFGNNLTEEALLDSFRSHLDLRYFYQLSGELQPSYFNSLSLFTTSMLLDDFHALRQTLVFVNLAALRV
jgi:hypothetical protein